MEQKNVQEFIEYQSEKFTKRIIFKKGENAVFLLNFSGDQALPAHKHPGADLYLLVLEGGGTFKIDGKDVPAKKGDTLFVEGEEEFAFVNDPKSETSLYVMLNKVPGEEYAKNI